MLGLLDGTCWARWSTCCKSSLSCAALARRCRMLAIALFADQGQIDRLLVQSDQTLINSEDVCESHETSFLVDRFEECQVTFVDNDTPPRIAFDDRSVSLGQGLLERIADALLRARSVTEQATLTVGKHVSELFEIARRDNDAAGNTLLGLIGATGEQGASNDGISAVVSEQRALIDRFVMETKECFARQVNFSSSAVTVCREMERAVAAIEKLVFSSEILAFNVQVESIRLGEQGRAFSVLGEEMVRFSSQISQANGSMQKSLNTVSETMQRLHSESVSVDSRLSDFAASLSSRMQGVQDRTGKLTDSLNDTLQLITTSNEMLMSHSQSALSELQFQDPLAQDLLLTHHEVLKIQQLLTTGVCEDTSLADIDPAVGNDGRVHREAGEVDLF